MALVGVAMGLLGTTLIGASIYTNKTSAENETGATGEDAVQYTVQRLASVTETSSPAPSPTKANAPALLADAPAPTLTVTVAKPASSAILDESPDEITPPVTVAAITGTGEITLAATEPPVTPTATATASPTPTSTATDAAPAATPTVELVSQADATESYTMTNQVAPPPSANAEPTPTPEPETAAICPVESGAQFELIPIEGNAVRDHPDAVHGDLNLALRGYIPAGAPLEQVHYNGATDALAPRLHGLFEPNRQAQITTVYRVNDWIWESGRCGGHPRGCPGPPAEDYWPVTLVGLATTPGERIFIPERGPDIYPGGFKAMVLFAEARRITLGYTRRDTVSTGYTVHIENVCVDPNLVALYQAQMDAAGWHATGHLPALRNNQSFGAALNTEIKVAIRDAGTFMDPRSHKDWWQ